MDFIKSSVILMLPALPDRMHINISSCIREYQLFFSHLWLSRREMMLLCLARGQWVPPCILKTLPTPLHCTALLAPWLSGVWGLISKQTDLILMPRLQLFSPESLSTEPSSHEPTDTTCSWYLNWPLPLHFSSIQPSAWSKTNAFLEQDTASWFILSKQQRTIPLQSKSIAPIDFARENKEWLIRL